MKRGFVALLLLSVVWTASAASYEHAIRTSYQEDGSELNWYVSDDQFMRTPEWKFDGKSSPPFPMGEAYQRAKAWLNKSFPKMSSFKLREYSVSSAGSSRAPNRWYYTFDFMGDLDGSIVTNSRFSVMVLMDGTVIEPKSKK